MMRESHFTGGNKAFTLRRIRRGFIKEGVLDAMGLNERRLSAVSPSIHSSCDQAMQELHDYTVPLPGICRYFVRFDLYPFSMHRYVTSLPH